jgi:hypothetical protein
METDYSQWPLPKFSLYQTVFYLTEKGIEENNILGIKIKYDDGNEIPEKRAYIRYYVGNYKKFKENQLFATKEELIKTL